MTEDPGKGTDFWSRRRAAVRESEDQDRKEAAAQQLAQERAALEAKTDEEILEELELPDPDTLTDKDDFSRFLSEAVPERLRRRALRRLWGVNPVLANLDGLVEYAEDYTDAATVVENMQTVYQVGKGMFDRFAEVFEEGGDVEVNSSVEEAKEEYVNNDAVQDEINVALHQSTDEDEAAFVQLTQADVLVQDANLLDKCASSDDVSAHEELEVHPPRRRMRFDYS